MGASLWVALTAVGAVILVTKALAGHNLVTAVLVRVAALSFLGAGIVGADGWVGRWTNDLITWAMSMGKDASSAAFGTAIAIGVVVALGSFLWLLALLPDHWWGGQMPDWGSVLALFLPALAVSIPGPAGRWFREDVFPFLAGIMINAVRGLFGV